MLKRLWLRWQCWRHSVCWKCGEWVPRPIRSAHIAWCDKNSKKVLDLSVGIKGAILDKSWEAIPEVNAKLAEIASLGEKQRGRP